jgi:hypothetical protein
MNTKPFSPWPQTSESRQWIAHDGKPEDTSLIDLPEQRKDRAAMTAYLYDSAGQWIAFRTDTGGRYLFDTTGAWIGWFPWDDENDAVTPDGEYLGTVVQNRLLWRTAPTYRGTPGYPGAPAFPGHASYPGSVGYGGYVPGFEDVPPSRLIAHRAPAARSGGLHRAA